MGVNDVEIEYAAIFFKSKTEEKAKEEEKKNRERSVLFCFMFVFKNGSAQDIFKIGKVSRRKGTT